MFLAANIFLTVGAAHWSGPIRKKSNTHTRTRAQSHTHTGASHVWYIIDKGLQPMANCSNNDQEALQNFITTIFFFLLLSMLLISSYASRLVTYLQQNAGHAVVEINRSVILSE